MLSIAVNNLGVVQQSNLPLFLWACPHALAVRWFWFLLILVSFCSCHWLIPHYEGTKPPLYGWWGSLFIWVGAFYINEVDASSSCFLTWRGTYPLHPPCLVLLTMTQFWWVVALISRLTIWWHLWAVTSFPLPNACVASNVYSHITLPKVFTHLQLMIQWTSTVEFITSH